MTTFGNKEKRSSEFRPCFVDDNDLAAISAAFRSWHDIANTFIRIQLGHF